MKKISKTTEERILKELENSDYNVIYPLDIAQELGCSSLTVIAIGKRNGWEHRQGYRKTCQGCLRSQQEAGYYPAKLVRINKK